jgi:hypothetical protein
VTHLAVVASTATQSAIGSDFLRGLETLQQVVFVLPGVRSVGEFWLTACPSLTSVSFEGLGALASVGDSWLRDCRSLSSVSFEGLGALVSVGDSWLRDSDVHDFNVIQCKRLNTGLKQRLAVWQ